MDEAPHVGTLRERPLHAGLKRWYTTDGARAEVPVGGFVVDLVRPDLLVEIQTRGFSSMRRKLTLLLEQHAVLLVHPVAAVSRIVRVSDGGEVLSRRTSPRHGEVCDVFAELVAFPELVSHPRFSLEVVLVEQEELRRFDGRRAWRRHGWVVEERRLLAVLDQARLDTPAALAALLPAGLPAEFTTADLAAALGRPRRLAQQMAYCLRRVGVLEVVGKQGNTVRYGLGDGMEPAAPG